MPEWDNRNRPKGYIISVTPGFAQYGQGEERLQNMGLARKLVKAARLGFEFAEIDFEELSEMFEPDIEKQVNQVKTIQNLEVGLHLPVSMDLCLAESYLWRQMHIQLSYGAIAAAEKLKSKFILFHTSSRARPSMASRMGGREYPAKMAAWNGTNLGYFIRNEGMLDWFMAKFIRVLFSAMGLAGDPAIVTYFDEKATKENKGFEQSKKDAETERNRIYEKYITPKENAIQQEIEQFKTERDQLREEIANEQRKLQPDMIKFERFARRIEYINQIEIPRRESREYKNQVVLKALKESGQEERFNLLDTVVSYSRSHNFYNVFDYWASRGSEAEEHIAYHVTAKWMFKNKDPLYVNIVKKNTIDPDKLVYDANTKANIGPETARSLEEIITAVAAKYTHGHLITKETDYAIPVDRDGKFTKRLASSYMSVLDYCKRHKVHVFIETNMPGGHEGEGGGAPPGELRIIKATDHVEIVKAIDPENLSYCMDFEHLLTNYVDPEAEAEELAKNGGGKYVRCLHTNAPRPIKGAHATIFPISNDMYILYRYLHKMRQAGCKNTYIIWEMGSYGVRESAIAYRRLIHALESETHPDKLSKEFFGLDKTFEALQNTAIREHAFDPLEGTLQIPEESHTFLGKSAVDKGKAELWARRKYR